MRVSEIFEAVVPGAAGKAALVAAGDSGAPPRAEGAFESVLVGIGPVVAPAAPEPGRAQGFELPRFPGKTSAALDVSPAPEGSGAGAAENPEASAEPVLLPVSHRGPVGAAAVLEDTLAEALSLRRQAETGAEAAIAPLAFLMPVPPPPLPSPVELLATESGAAEAVDATVAEASLPGDFAASARNGVALSAAAGQVPGIPQPQGHFAQGAAAAPMARVPRTEPPGISAAAPSNEPASARGAEVLAPGGGIVLASRLGPDVPMRGIIDSPVGFGAEPSAAPGEPGLRPAEPEARGIGAAAGAPPADLPAWRRDAAAVPGRGLDVGRPEEGAKLERIAQSAVPAEGTRTSGDRAAKGAAPLAGAALPGAVRVRAAETPVPAPSGASAVQAPDFASGPVGTEVAPSAPASVGLPGGTLVAEPGSAGLVAPLEAAVDAADAAPEKEAAGNPQPPGGGPATTPAAQPAGTWAGLATAASARGSKPAMAEARGTKEMLPAAELNRPAGAEAATAPDGAPGASGPKAAVALERSAAGAGPGAIPEPPPAAGHGFGEGPSGVRDAAAAPHAAPEARAEIGARAAQQVAAALTASPEGRIELRFDPEELGPVRLGLAPGDGTITVQIAAERGETLELLRRHADLLARELRQAGYGAVSFQFGADTASGGGAAPRHGYAPPATPVSGDAARSDPAALAAPHASSAPHGLGTGVLDLRL